MAPSSDGSNGCATMSDGSGTERPASWFSGIFEPYASTCTLSRIVDRGAPRPHAAQLVPDVLGRGVHPLVDFGEQPFQIVDIHAGR